MRRNTFMSLTALLWRLLIISSNQRPLCSIHTMMSPCSSQVVSFEYVAFQVTHTCRCDGPGSLSEHERTVACRRKPMTETVFESRRTCSLRPIPSTTPYAGGNDGKVLWTFTCTRNYGNESLTVP